MSHTGRTPTYARLVGFIDTQHALYDALMRQLDAFGRCPMYLWLSLTILILSCKKFYGSQRNCRTGILKTVFHAKLEIERAQKMANKYF